jgi:rhodanese-related sulfurtransferase
MNIKKGFRQLVAEAEQQIQSRSPAEVAASLAEPGTLLVDLRDVRELRREGKIAGALHVPRGMLEFWIDPDSPYYRQEFEAAEQLILYCNKGWRSALATRALLEMGLDNVCHMRGGLEAWQAEELPVEAPPER